ncbi:MAG: F0F1 ATP synthase subunit B, partial [Rhizomicrobium sp.]
MEMLHEAEFWEAVGFVLVIAILVWKGVPGMVAKMLDKRAATISTELNEARRLREEAAALLADYKARAAGAEREAESIISDARAEVIRFAAAARDDLKSQIQRRAQAAQDRIAQAETAAM